MGEGEKPTESEVGGGAGGEGPESVQGLAHRSVTPISSLLLPLPFRPSGMREPQRISRDSLSLVSWSCWVSITLNQRSLPYHRVLNRFSKLDSVIAVLEDMQL